MVRVVGVEICTAQAVFGKSHSESLYTPECYYYAILHWPHATEHAMEVFPSNETIPLLDGYSEGIGNSHVDIHGFGNHDRTRKLLFGQVNRFQANRDA